MKTIVIFFKKEESEHINISGTASSNINIFLLLRSVSNSIEKTL